MINLQIGAGLDGPPGWLNLDASPVLRLQRLPVLGSLLQRTLSPRFSLRVDYGDVVRGLALPANSAGLVYTSHMLEHLSLDEFCSALLEVHRVLAPGGVFRSVLPDLELEVHHYLASTAPDRASDFMRSTILGSERREFGVMPALRGWLGNSSHRWMWDYPSIASRLAAAGFDQIRRASFGDSAHAAFNDVENAERWRNSLGFECRKPA